MIEDLAVFEGVNCTINTTEDCNLRCKYCYEINKKPKSIDFNACKKFIDLLLDTDFVVNATFRDSSKEKLLSGSPAIVLDFIGGDSLINPQLLDDILSYFLYAVHQRPNHPFTNRWRASLSTNGTLFEREDVRKFCEKWKDNLSLGISIDGCPEIHDMNRIFPDGRGSMETIMKYWNWYKQNFPIQAQSTKATCSKASIPYLYKSLKFMHEELGINYVNQNFIMEDTGCTQEDYDELDRQLEMCVDYVLEHKDEMYWSMIDKAFATSRRDPQTPISSEKHCGSGAMPTLAINGDIYPCFRWLPHTQRYDIYENKFICGNVFKENSFKREAFDYVNCNSCRNLVTKDAKCINCEYEPCCPYCIAGCYSEFGEFRRTTHICEIFKRQCYWAEIYWEKYLKG